MRTTTHRTGKLWLLLIVCLSSQMAFGQSLASLHTVSPPLQEDGKKVSDKALKAVLTELETKHSVYFIYESEVINNKFVPSNQPSSQGLEESLKNLLKPLDLKFEKVKNNMYIIVATNNGKVQLNEITRNYASPLYADASGQRGMDVYEGIILKTSQDDFRNRNMAVTITGRVTAQEDKSGLPGVNVLLKGSTNGTTTDGNGNYTLSVPEATGTLVFSYIGYTTEEVPINGRTTIDIAMVADIKSLSEVVVVGYGTQKKSQLTGAISSVSSKEISELPIANAQQALQGRAPGIDVMAEGGRPGQGVSVRVRGRRSFSAGNEPLYVVDGIPLAGGINDINPNDIESMEILKDASATAIYGSRGANGVVIITTRRGTSGKATISYDGYFGLVNSIGKVDVFNAAEFAEYKRESRRARNAYTTDEALFDAVELKSIQEGRNTDYWDLIERQGTQQSHQIGVTGGSEKTQFAVTANHFYEKGITPGQDFTRNTIRINLDHSFSDRLKVGTSTLASLNIQNWGPNPWPGALQENPLGVPYDDNGRLLFRPTTDGARTNPLHEIIPGAVVDENRRVRVFSSIYGEYKILDGLSFRVNFGPDNQNRRNGIFNASLTNSRQGGSPTARQRYWNTFSYTLENILKYNKTFNAVHTIDATGLFSIQKQRDEFLDASVSGLPYEYQQYYNIGSAAVVEGVGSNLTEWGILSYMGRLNYSFKEKYNLTLTGRIDGSSRFAGEVGLFGDTKKYGFFPSAAVAWNIHQENFMQNLNFLSNLKLRASYGATGNTGINPYQTQGSLTRSVYAFGNTGAFGFRPGALVNPDLRWETTKTLNIGLDYGLFDYRISGSVEFYEQNTTDLLMQRQLPWSGGYGSVLANVGATRNKGIEFSLSTINLDLPNGFKWTTDLNVFANKEQIVELYGGKEDDPGNRWFIGKPLTVFWDLEKIGIWQQGEEDQAKIYSDEIGQIKVRDVNADGKINDQDRVILGSDVPKWSGGITNRVEFKGFDLSFFVFTRQKYMIRSAFHDNYNLLFGRYNNLDVDYWTPTNPTNAYPRPIFNQERPKYNTTMSYFDGSFVKVRNITLGYNFPSALAEKMKMQSLRIYASAQNPFIFSKFAKGIDPERVRTPENGVERTAEIGADTPSVRIVLLGLNVRF
ncbi:TonB-dependent receptor [Rhodocytophaga aerolata]|uniref:TonB-dependent receptor n=1 Tax=Rhodocytophaga aerolata TaxID=455078 RepID=A0ABT8R5R4_9BACT|nr:TonB-dependent receptor [Rhodocytophaga aerolata]MDO1447441.1 TonB-dependent receptor [Rhodocytophaga aerolata]